MVRSKAHLPLVAAVAIERGVELVVSRRHARAMLEGGGVDRGASHYPAMVALHAALLAGSAIEPIVARRRFDPRAGAPMIGLVLLAQALRWWSIASLGVRWSTRVIVPPGAPRIRRGPYRFASHPNYAAVVVEGVALPLACSAWLTAAVFTALDAALLAVRVRVEERALAEAGA